MTKQLIACFDNRILTMGLKLQLDKFLGFMKETYSLTVCHCNMNELDENNRQILSSCSLTDKKISIDLSLVNTNRYAFIVAHEVGHFLLHNKLQISQQQYERYQDSIFSFSENRYLLANERNWIEWQANQFATCLLLPRDCILFQLYKALEKIGRNGSKPLYVDEQRCNQQDFHSVIGNLAVYFGTSKKSIIYRLNALEMIHFNYRMKSIGQILKELIDEDAFWLA